MYDIDTRLCHIQIAADDGSPLPVSFVYGFLPMETKYSLKRTRSLSLKVKDYEIKHYLLWKRAFKFVLFIKNAEIKLTVFELNRG